MADTALIVCTVLPQEELALALGADGFLQKPVTREAFLAMLERHSAIT
jgi:CheY-like chemotaxis protein